MLARNVTSKTKTRKQRKLIRSKCKNQNRRVEFNGNCDLRPCNQPDAVPPHDPNSYPPGRNSFRLSGSIDDRAKA